MIAGGVYKRWKITFREEEEPVVELQVNADDRRLMPSPDVWETVLYTDDVQVELVEPEVIQR